MKDISKESIDDYFTDVVLKELGAKHPVVKDSIIRAIVRDMLILTWGLAVFMAATIMFLALENGPGAAVAGLGAVMSGIFYRRHSVRFDLLTRTKNPSHEGA